MGNKSEEQKCLDIVNSLKNFPETQGIDNRKIKERPDFVFGNTGIEHFLIDFIENKGSIKRKQTRRIIEKIDYYNDNPAVKETDLSNGKAAEFVENVINEQFRGIMDFKYSDFINNFKRVYKKHYDNIIEYRKNCNKLGFLIEIPYLVVGTKTNFRIVKDGKSYNIKPIRPILTNGMIECFEWDNNVDFIILCYIPFNCSDESKSKIYKINLPLNKEKLKKDFSICDEFDFPKIYKKENKIKLNVI